MLCSSCKEILTIKKEKKGNSKDRTERLLQQDQRKAKQSKVNSALLPVSLQVESKRATKQASKIKSK